MKLGCIGRPCLCCTCVATAGTAVSQEALLHGDASRRQHNRQETQMLKAISILCAVSFAATAAMAQTAPTPPKGPTAVECQQGWKDGSQWKKAEFEAACMKIKDREKR
jgi:hypothetical protein